MSFAFDFVDPPWHATGPSSRRRVGSTTKKKSLVVVLEQKCPLLQRPWLGRVAPKWTAPVGVVGVAGIVPGSSSLEWWLRKTEQHHCRQVLAARAEFLPCRRVET